MVPFVELQQEHVEGARVFSQRKSLVDWLIPRSGVIAELGVAYGDFAEFLLTTLVPVKYVGIDFFTLTGSGSFMGYSPEERFGGLSHLEFVIKRFINNKHVEIRRGGSAVELAKFPNRFFDFIYVDASHDYGPVRLDLEVSNLKAKRGGYIILDDYTTHGHIEGGCYGVVPAVNEFVVEGHHKVVGFAINNFYWNIAIQIA
jgi:hypothetical protein